MAIDILSRDTQTPIVVGDKADMKLYQRCAMEMIGDTPYLILTENAEASEDDPEEFRCAMSAKAGADFLKNEFVVLVALSEDDAITHAVLTPLNDLVSPVRELAEPEITQLAEMLVEGDFHLDFLRQQGIARPEP